VKRAFLPLLAVLGVSASVALGSAVGATPADHPYLNLGDSLAAGSGASSTSNRYADLLYADYQTSLDANQLISRAQGGTTSGGMRTGGQLATALADINDVSDMKAVTISIGGNDALSGSCTNQWDNPSACPFRANFADILNQIRGALAADGGDEVLLVTALYNPASGEGTPQEAGYDLTLLGSNGTLGCNDTNTSVGANDVIFQEAGAQGVRVADPYPAFKANGQAYMSNDNIHPNDAGYAAMAQAFRDATILCPNGRVLPDPDPGPAPAPDTDPPQTSFLATPPARTLRQFARFRFRSDEAGSTFRCKLDGRPSGACASPRVYRHLDQGRHALRVKATDPAGNTDRTPALKRWRVLPRP
jgi:lysophospholipase L1-like esterase